MSRISKFIEARNAAFRNPTLETAGALIPTPAEGWKSQDVPLASLHKGRLQWIGATDAMLEESKAWLTAHGYKTSCQGLEPLTPAHRDLKRVALGLPPLGRVS